MFYTSIYSCRFPYHEVCYTVASCFLRITSISGPMLASMSSVLYWGFQPIERECVARQRQLVP